MARRINEHLELPNLPPPAPDWPERRFVAILDEIGYDPLGHELWQDYRLARLCAETPADRRRHLVSGKPSVDVRERQLMAAPELAEPLAVFAALRAGHVNDEALRIACGQISDWADGNGYAVAALEFARAAAGVAPDNPEAANLAALVLRRAGDWRRSERYYVRAIVLGRDGDAVQYVCGHIGLAALCYARGQSLDAAVAHLHTAARVARDQGSLWLASHVRHDTMLILVAREDFHAAEDEAVRAAELYPLHDDRFPYFGIDFAFVQLEQFRYPQAFPILTKCMELVPHPPVRALVHSMLARCHAGLNCIDEYLRHARTAEELAVEHPEHASTVHYHLSEAARACRGWEAAERHASQSRELAVARGDREMVRLAERSLSVARHREPAPTPSVAPLNSPPELLTRTLGTRLARWKPASGARSARRSFRNQWVA